jgi:hypothetical protein
MLKHGFLIAILAALILGESALAQTMKTGRLLECTVKDTAITRDDGSLGETDITRTFAIVHQAFLFDEAQSTLRWISTDRSWQSDTVWQYETIQAGSDDNSLLAIRYYEGSRSVILDVLRIKSWVNEWPFTLMEQETIYSGNCKKL